VSTDEIVERVSKQALALYPNAGGCALTAVCLFASNLQQHAAERIETLHANARQASDLAAAWQREAALSAEIAKLRGEA
jgi:hypothetical protein